MDYQYGARHQQQQQQQYYHTPTPPDAGHQTYDHTLSDPTMHQGYDSTYQQHQQFAAYDPPVGYDLHDGGLMPNDSYQLQPYTSPSGHISPYDQHQLQQNTSYQPHDITPYRHDNDSTYFRGDITQDDDQMESPLLPVKFPRELRDGQPSPGGTDPYFNQVPAGAQPRRYKTMKRVELYHGNLVLDCPIPKKLLETLPIKDGREFTHMRYTAATGDPSEFKTRFFTLRQVLYTPPRQTELFIVITMYNV